MRRLLVYAFFILLALPACSKKSGSTITVVKPKYHHRWYQRKADRKTKRVKTVRVRN